MVLSSDLDEPSTCTGFGLLVARESDAVVQLPAFGHDSLMEPMGVAPMTSSLPRKRSPTELRPHDSDDELVGEMFLRALSNELPPDESGG